MIIEQNQKQCNFNL